MSRPKNPNEEDKETREEVPEHPRDSAICPKLFR